MEEGGSRSTNRPKNSAFKQQRLKAWQPILTAQVAIVFFLIVFVVFIIIGAVLLVASDSVIEREIEYTECYSSNIAGKTCDEHISENAGVENATACICKLTFTLSEAIDKEVYLYYGLTNFYQNHRRYVRSRDDAQLRGDLSQSVDSDCKPYDKEKNTSKAIAPCGTIANSMFNDTFELVYIKESANKTKEKIPIHMTYKNIAWKSDRETKFRNPDNMAEFKDYAKPPNWRRPVYNLSSDTSNNGFENQDFIVWMRTAAFPTFRKPYRKVIHEDTFIDNLPKGDYELTVHYNFPVTSFDGEKRFIISNTSWLGGKNSFLGIAYLVVGVISAVMVVVFTYIHLKVKSSITGSFPVRT